MNAFILLSFFFKSTIKSGTLSTRKHLERKNSYRMEKMMMKKKKSGNKNDFLFGSFRKFEIAFQLFFFCFKFPPQRVCNMRQIKSPIFL